MPTQPLQYCSDKSFPKCRVKVERGRCEPHRKAFQKERDRYRGSAASRGYGRRWQKARKGFLARHPLCVTCDLKNIVTAATVVDHIKPHRGNQSLFWDRNNWQALCKPCHDRKTATEEGSWASKKY